MRWAGEGGNERGRNGRGSGGMKGGSEQESGRMEGGKREEGRYITVRGFRGLGWAGPSSAARHTRHTGAPS